MSNCRVCNDVLREFFDFGHHPLSSAFVPRDAVSGEFFFRLAVGICASCTMVQLLDDVPREQMVHRGYPYHSSSSSVMRKHFEETAHRFLETELTGSNPFIIEIGCNDGVTLNTIREAGVRNLGVEPSGVGSVRVHNAFFDGFSAAEIFAEEGPADVIYSANTICGVPDIYSIFVGVEVLLASTGIFVFEDPYLGEIINRTSFDQIYDEHTFFFTAHSVQAMATRFGFELVDVERLPVHGGQIRYTIARAGQRQPTVAVAELCAEEEVRGLAKATTLDRFASNVQRVREDLMALLHKLRAAGCRIVGYGATAKSSTVTNYCGIGSGLVSFVCDTTPSKHGKLTPGSHIPVLSPEAFREPYPDYALLFAWNHAEEIMAKEQAFRSAGGRWILYVPDVHII